MYNYFSNALLHWYDQHGRKNLPWQHPRDPYRVWVSEIMLQQTQVQTVIPYFQRFIATFPTVSDLARADEDAVLSLWSGLGYYSRARNLHRSAQLIQQQHQGRFPQDIDALTALPGIGASTAAAILSQAFNQPTAILDANVKRVISRFFRISGWSEQAAVKKQLWSLAQSCMPAQRCADYTQAIMDLGAMCCTSRNPSCTSCPVQTHCLARQSGEQTLYPERKSKKAVPLRAQQFLLLHTKNQQIYLEKRPPTGLWGGLWCLPALEMDQCPLAFIEKEYQLAGGAPKEIADFKHCFSHFHLQIKALSIQVDVLPGQIAESRGKWFTSEEWPLLGLAKPTVSILKSARSLDAAPA